MKQLKEVIKNIITIELKIELTVVFDLDFGHTDPKWILPLNTEIEVNYEESYLKILESPFGGNDE